MFTSIVILIVAISGLISTVLANKRVDKLQEEINNINKASEYISSVNTDNIRGILKEINDIKISLDRLESSHRSNYNLFTSRVDKLRNDVLNNGREY
jgi:uncharacterized protein YoxC